MSFIITLLCLLPVKTYVKAEDNNKGQEGSDDENRRLLSVNFDRTVYTFIAVRGLFVHSALVAPYFMLESDQKATSLLPVYLAAQALAALLSSFLFVKASVMFLSKNKFSIQNPMGFFLISLTFP